jgi:CubicO group peptidase (beta-lactamase class C family)
VALERSIDAYLDEADPPGLANVRAVLVSVDGSTVAARYRGSGPEQTGHVWSVTKSVLSMLVGIAIADGHLRGLDQSLAELLPAYRTHLRADTASITLQQLLSMTSGITDGPEAGMHFDPADPDIVEPSWTVRSSPRPALGGSTRTRRPTSSPLRFGMPPGSPCWTTHAPGCSTRWASAPARRTRASRSSRHWRCSPTSSSVPASPGEPTGRASTSAASMLKLTAADMVKLGELYLAQGSWHGRRIVPAEWVKTSITPVEPAPQDGSSYGLLWWLFELNGHQAYAAIGSSGQGVLVVPDLHLVVAISSRDDGPLPSSSRCSSRRS